MYLPVRMELAAARVQETVGYLISAAQGEVGVNPTYPERRALIYVAS